MVKFVIWGVGRNGKMLFDFLERESVVAFIDEYANVQNYKGVPVIRLREYLRCYSDYPVIISVEKSAEIEECLLENNVFQYYKLWNEYNEVIKLICQANRELLLQRHAPGLNIEIVQDGLAAVLLYNLLEQNERQPFFRESDNMKIQWLRKRGFIKTTSVDCPIKIDLEKVLGDDSLCEHPELKKFKDCHVKERCFIVGTGPSLRMEDLDVLYANKEICISVNGIFKGFSQTLWRPDYYIISDWNGVYQWKEDILKMDVREKFIADVCCSYRAAEMLDNMHKWHMAPLENPGELPSFSEDFSKISYNGDTIAYDGALQLAAYMGFEQIFLLGMDCCQYEKGEQHFVKGYQDAEHANAVQHPELQILAYRSAREYAEKNGIEIYNATRGGRLEVFERVDFDTLFGNCAV